MTVGLAVLTRAVTFPEKWAIIAGTKDKAKIIMDYIIQHIFDNDFTQKRFIAEEGASYKEIRRHRNKNRLTFVVGQDDSGKDLISEVFVGAAKDALGFGASNVVEDESALIDDAEHSLVLRMLGDNPQDNFMAKIGNPFNRNHFLQSYHDPAYMKINVDCYKSLEEGRITKDFIEENRPYAYFKVLFENRFPSGSEVDESGWMGLLDDSDLKVAQERILERTGRGRLGIDVARSGRNYNAWVLRTDNFARVLQKDLDNDLISISDTTANLMKEHGIEPNDVFVDDSGVGGGVTDYLKSIGIKVTPVNFGERAQNNTEHLNVRAEVYAGRDGVASWIKQSGKLEPHKDWIELTKIRYKKDATGKIRIEPKEEMRKRGIESPDVADALALTFASSSVTSYHKVDPLKILQGGVKPYFPGMPG